MFGPCKVCLEKDKRILDLKEEITHLRAVLNPPPRINKYEMEQDYILDGANEPQRDLPTPISEEDRKQQEEKQLAIQREYDAILSGSY